MESIQAINKKIGEVDAKIRVTRGKAEEIKREMEQQEAKLLEIEAEIAETEKLNKAFECLQTLDISKIKSPELNINSLSEAVGIIRHLCNVVNHIDEVCPRRICAHDYKSMLIQSKNDLAKYEKEIKDSEEYLQGLFAQLKFEIEQQRQTLDKILQSNQELINMHQRTCNQEINPEVMTACDASRAVTESD